MKHTRISEHTTLPTGLIIQTSIETMTDGLPGAEEPTSVAILLSLPCAPRTGIDRAYSLHPQLAALTDLTIMGEYLGPDWGLLAHEQDKEGHWRFATRNFIGMTWHQAVAQAEAQVRNIIARLTYAVSPEHCDLCGRTLTEENIRLAVLEATDHPQDSLIFFCPSYKPQFKSCAGTEADDTHRAAVWSVE